MRRSIRFANLALIEQREYRFRNSPRVPGAKAVRGLSLFHPERFSFPPGSSLPIGHLQRGQQGRVEVMLDAPLCAKSS